MVQINSNLEKSLQVALFIHKVHKITKNYKKILLHSLFFIIKIQKGVINKI